jgi:serine phosphatase RsbU (regulator of sigma subunit)
MNKEPQKTFFIINKAPLTIMEADWLIPKLTNSEKKEFSIYYNKRSIFLFRITSFTVFFASVAYFYLDYLSAPHSYVLLWYLRIFADIVLLTGLVISFLYKNFFIQNFQFIVNTLNLIYNICILLMIYFSRPDEMSYSNYYIGLLVIWIVAIPLRIRLLPLIINVTIIATIYVLIATLKQNLIEKNIDIFINNMFFLLSTTIAVIIAAYVLEIFIRKSFINEKLLKNKNQEILTQKEEILAQRDELEEQKGHLEKTNKEITDSIQYAKRIQKAVLPYAKLLEAHYENFILFYPRDIVSGDFYWFKKITINNKELTFIAVADCTGHGVPGSLVSMLGVSLLNEIIISKNTYNAAQILDELRTRIKATFYTEGDNERKDGMDIALIIIDEEEKQLQFSGAFRPLYICRKKTNINLHEIEHFKIHDEHPDNILIEIKPDKMPIGWYIVEKDFTNKYLKLQTGDNIYMFSDGYTDQIGGESRRKFSIKPFRQLLCSVYDKNMNEQKQILDKKLNEWKRDNKQIDDILVLGIKI